MKEHDFIPSPNSGGEDAIAPQAVPRAGLGIADQLGFTTPETPIRNGASTPALHEDAEEIGEAEQNLELDPATIPELAPLAVSNSGVDPFVTSRRLDEFDIEEARRGKYSASSGNGGGDDNNQIINIGHDDNSPGAFVSDLFSHLAELRARILYSFLAVAVASGITWHFGQTIQTILARPILRSLKASGLTGQLITIEPQEGFYLYFQITLAAAIILAAPVILFQMWRFIEPALTKTERRYSIVLIPFSILLFFSGVALGYVMSPLFFNFFLQFQPPETVANFSYGSSVALLAKMLLVFGACFQVPVVTIFLNKIGIVSRNFLIEYWRHAVVIIFLIVAIITPTWDPLTLIACATPPCLLYVLSIWLVKWL